MNNQSWAKTLLMPDPERSYYRFGGKIEVRQLADSMGSDYQRAFERSRKLEDLRQRMLRWCDEHPSSPSSINELYWRMSGATRQVFAHETIALLLDILGEGPSR